MPPVDLFSWPLVRECERAAEKAEEAWRTAQRRFRRAPHGERQNRLSALKTAAAAALRAETELAQLLERIGE